MSLRRFFFDPLEREGDRVRLTGAEARHIRDVLRVKPGGLIVLMDGRGGAFHACIREMDAETVTAELVAPLEMKTDSPLEFTVAQGFLKEKKMDDLIRPLTELGVHRWTPFFSRRSVPVPDRKRLEKRRERWRRIARESVKQCGRSVEMEISEPVNFETLVSQGGEGSLRVIFWEDARFEAPVFSELAKTNPNPSRALGVLGPEGGFSAEEIDMAVQAGFQTATLGPRILRAETAAVTAAVLIQYFLGDLNAAAF